MITVVVFGYKKYTNTYYRVSMGIPIGMFSELKLRRIDKKGVLTFNVLSSLKYVSLIDTSYLLIKLDDSHCILRYRGRLDRYLSGKR